MTNFEKVGIFMKTFGQEVKEKAGLGNEKLNQLRLGLIKEELDELNNAIDDIFLFFVLFKNGLKPA